MKNISRTSGSLSLIFQVVAYPSQHSPGGLNIRGCGVALQNKKGVVLI